jgi:hypothetical protein
MRARSRPSLSRLWVPLGVVAGAVGLTAAPVQAATLSVRVEPPKRGPWANLDYRAAPGEANRFEAVTVDEQTIRVSDTGALITPTPPCVSVDEHTAICATATLVGVNGLISVRVRAGDLDDVIVTRGPGLGAEGGPGNDVLDARTGVSATLNGGGGHDALLGGSNSDTLIDGDLTGAADADVLDGRGGGDGVSYAARTAPVRVDLAHPGSDGETGEGDILRHVSTITGGAGADTLIGDHDENGFTGGDGNDLLIGGAGTDFFTGGPGDDRITAGPGNDYVFDDAGADRLDGGPGEDEFTMGERGPDRITCGAGVRDRLLSPDSRDVIGFGCEYAYVRKHGVNMRIELRPRASTPAAITFRFQCPSSDELDGETIALRGSIRIRRATGQRGELGRGTVPGGPGRLCGEYEQMPGPDYVDVPVLFNARGRREASRRSGLQVTVEFRGRGVPNARWTMRIPTRSPARVAMMVPRT